MAVAPDPVVDVDSPGIVDMSTRLEHVSTKFREAQEPEPKGARR
jgi:hypothetical protein